MAQIPFATNLLGQTEDQETTISNPEMVAGLGLGGGLVSARLGSQPPTSAPLSPFAQQVANADAARLAQMGRPNLVGTPVTQTTTPRLIGSTPPQYTGTPTARPVPGTSVVPTGQPPVVSSTGGSPAAVRPTGGAPAVQNMDYRVNTSRPSTLARGAGLTALYSLADMGVAGLTGKGISERIGEQIGTNVGSAFLGDTSQPAITDKERDMISAGINPATGTPVSIDDSMEEEVTLVPTQPLSEQESIDMGLSPQEVAPTPLSLPSEVAPGSPQANFLAQREQGALSPQQIAQAEEFARQMGTTFSPETGYSRDPFLSDQASRTSTPLPGQTLSQFMRYEDQPIQRTEQFVDPQGRLRRRMTPAASSLMGLPEGTQPLAPQYAGFEAESAARQARIGGTGSFEGDSAARIARLNARPDFMEAQRSDAGQTMTDADRRDLAKASMPGASASDIARGMKVAERTKPQPTQGTVEKYGDREFIRQPDGSLEALKPIEGPFVPSIIEAEGGGRIVQLSPGHAQFIPDGVDKEIIKNLQDELAKAKEGSFEQFSQQADQFGVTGRGKTAFILAQMNLGSYIKDILGEAPIEPISISGEGTPSTGQGSDSLGLGL